MYMCHANDAAPKEGKLGRYFTVAEFLRSDTALARGIENIPGEEEMQSLRALVLYILDPLRAHLKAPIQVTSGFRSAALNKAIGGSNSSQHRLGQAADIQVIGYSPAEVAQAIRDLKLPYDQLIEEFGSWVHVSYGPRNRRQFLLARKQGGKTVYLNG